MPHFNNTKKTKFSEDAFIRAKQVVFEVFTILRGIDETQSISALAYLPGYSALIAPSIAVALLKNKKVWLLLEFIKGIIYSLVKPLPLQSAPIQLLVYPRENILNSPSLLIVLARPYMTREFIPVISKLLDDISSSNAQQSILFVSYYPESIQYIVNLISSSLFFEVYFISNFTTHKLIVSQLPTKNHATLLKSFAKLLIESDKFSLTSRLISLNCILKTRLLSYNSFFQFDNDNRLRSVLGKENFYNDLDIALLLDPADFKSLFYGLALRKHKNTTLVSLQFGTYGTEALEWSSLALNFHLVWSRHFMCLFERLCAGRSENANILSYKDCRFEFSSARPKTVSETLDKKPTLLVIGSMDPWPRDRLLSLERHIKKCANNLANLLRKSEDYINISVILRPHPLNQELLNRIPSAICSTNLIQSSNVLSEDLQRADFVIFLYPSTVLVHSLSRNIPSAILDMEYLPKWSTSWVPSNVPSFASDNLFDFIKFISQPFTNESYGPPSIGNKAISSNDFLGFDSPELYEVLSSIGSARKLKWSPQ